MADISKLEQQESFADEYGDRIAEWELFAVALICKELGRIGKMTPEQAKKYDRGFCHKCSKKYEKLIAEFFDKLTDKGGARMDGDEDDV